MRRAVHEDGVTHRMLSACVPHAVIQFLMAKNTSVVEIHKQLTNVYGGNIMSVQMVEKWCQEFCKGRCEVQDKSRTGCPKVVADESVNTIRVLLNKDRRLTLWELEMIMNNDSGNLLSWMSVSRIVTNLGTQFYQSSIQKLVSKYDKCLNLFGNYVEKWCIQKD